MKQGTLETLIGFAVLVVAFAFFIYAYNISNATKQMDGYLLEAHFENIEGLTVGSDVKMSGIKVGYVENIRLEKDTYFAIVKLRINKDVEVPSDSRVIISTSGLIGNKYVRINPGASEDNLAEGQKINLTQSALNIEDLIAKLMYSVTSK